MIKFFQEQIEKKTDIELLEIISNDTNWQKEYIDIAEIEAKKRNISLTEALHTRKVNHDRIQKEYEEGLNVNLGFLAFIYLIKLFEYSYSKVFWKQKTYYKYNLKTRMKAKNLLFIHVLIFLVVCCLKLIQDL